MTQGKRLAAIMAATLLGATALSGWATQDIAGRLNHDPALGPSVAGVYQPFAWVSWNTAPWAASYPRAFLPSRLGIMGLMFVGMGGIYLAVQRRPRPRAYTTTHGTAHFATQADIKRAGMLGGKEGLYCGAWTAKGQVYYLRHHEPEHVAVIAPTRSGKGVGPVLLNLLSYPGSAIILDEKTELWDRTAGWRQSIGQTVLRWQPGSADNSCAFNPLDEVRLKTEHEIADAQNVAIMIVDPDGKGLENHWDRTAFALISGVILHVMYRETARKKVATLTDVANALTDPAHPAAQLYTDMTGNTHVAGQRHDYVASAGREQTNRSEKERSSVLSTAVGHMKLFQDPIVARNCARSDFRIRDLMNAANPVSLYIQLPANDKLRLRPLARLLLTQIVRGIMTPPVKFDRSGRQISPHGHDTLLMFDEFPSYGRLAVFEEALSKLAGYGVRACLVMQDREQLTAAYGPHETLLSNTGVTIAYAPNKQETAEWLSSRTGQSTVNMEVISESGKRGGWYGNIARSIHQVGRPLMTSDEVRRMPGPAKQGSTIIAPGATLVFAAKLTIKGRQALYFEDPIFAARASIPAPVRSGTLTGTTP